MTAKQMTIKQNTAMAPSFGARGRGSENVGVDDLVIPRIGIVQSLSPERKKNDPAYIAGAEEGMMFNSVTRELYKDKVLAIPVFYRMEHLLWKPRKDGGGFRGAFPTAAEANKAAMALPEPTECVDTAQQFCLVSSDGGNTWSEAVVSMAKSNAGVSRRWNSDIRLRCEGAGLDRFVTIYDLGVATKKNDKGEFYVYTIEFDRFMTNEEEDLYKRAEAVYEAIASGTKDVARDYAEESDDEVGF